MKSALAGIAAVFCWMGVNNFTVVAEEKENSKENKSLTIVKASRIDDIETLLKEARHAWVISFESADNETESPLVIEGMTTKKIQILEKKLKDAIVSELIKPGAFEHAKDWFDKDVKEDNDIPVIGNLYILLFSGPQGSVYVRYQMDEGVVSFVDGERQNGSFRLKVSRRETAQILDSIVELTK